MAAVNCAPQRKSERQSGEWGCEANKWSLRASVDHSLAHVLCAPSRSRWTRHGRTCPVLLCSFDPFDLCRPYIATSPPPAASPFFFYGRSLFFIAGRAVHSPPFDGQRAIVEGG